MHEADLQLARDCVAGRPEAIAALDGALREVGRQVGRRLGIADAQLDEVLQTVRKIVLVPGSTGAPALAGFEGRSELATWLRIITTREALRARKAMPREQPADDHALLALIAPDDDPATQHLKSRYRSALKLALEDAIATLEPRDKAVLRYHVVDGLTVEELGRIYGVHRATAARWVEKARALLISRARRAAKQRLQIEGGELEEIYQLIHSRFEATLSRMLKTS